MEVVMSMSSQVAPRDRASVARPPVNPFGSLHREIDRLFDDFARGLGLAETQGVNNLMPRTDVTETDKEIQITAELPGLERKDVDISLEDNVLTIRGEKKIEKDEGDGSGKNVHVSERVYGMFYRVIELPKGVDPSRVQATMSNGVLKITIPKPSQSEAKKIEVTDAA
jgi:HSP20 family protein